MAAGRADFEVQVMKDGRWVTETIMPAEDQARACAKKFLADKKCEGARIVRNWNRADGTMVESTIFSETRAVRDDAPVRIVQIDDVPPSCCETPGDLAGAGARQVMNRLFRNYMEKAFVTPTELIHSYKELKRLQDKDTLLPSAVDRVAFLQTRESEKDSKTRRDELFKSIDEISVRARRAEKLSLPKLNGRFSDVLSKVEDSGEPGERDFLALVVLSRDLVDVRNWVGKLERLCKLAVEDDDPHSLQLLDGVIADVLGANVVQEILGWQPSLGSAICRMLDLADGLFPAEKSDAGESAEILNKLFADKKLPESRLCLIDRAHRQLRSANPLYRSDASKESEEFGRVLTRMLTPAGLAFGAETAEALTSRYTRMVEQGGAAGRRAAIAATFRQMPDRAYGVMYLAELTRTEFVKEHVPDIMECLETALSTRSIHEFVQRGLGPKDRMMRATVAHGIVMASPFPPEVRKRVADHIDGLLEKYLIDEQIVEKLDHPDSHLRDRAVRLVQFCAAGVMPEGKAMTRARQRILTLLRQPNFDAHFIDGIADPVRAQKSLRDFHQLLVRAGFG